MKVFNIERVDRKVTLNGENLTIILVLAKVLKWNETPIFII